MFSVESSTSIGESIMFSVESSTSIGESIIFSSERWAPAWGSMVGPVAMGFRLGVDGWTAAAQRLRICPRRPATPNSRWRPAGDAFRWRFLLAFDIRRRACDAVPWVDSSIISVAQNYINAKNTTHSHKVVPKLENGAGINLWSVGRASIPLYNALHSLFQRSENATNARKNDQRHSQVQNVPSGSVPNLFAVLHNRGAAKIQNFTNPVFDWKFTHGKISHMIQITIAYDLHSK